MASPVSQNVRSLSASVSNEDLFHDQPVNIGQSALNSVVVKLQSFVVDSQQMQNGGMQVVRCDRVFDDVITSFVRRAVSEA